ncbi:MAG: hydrogenase expression/formation protein [Burkholderiales bacterium]|jgi:hydrogenase-1 operon protein HyaF|nr:hydrogenase expression/formation protein [Burkholderiales bacterium]
MMTDSFSIPVVPNDVDTAMFSQAYDVLRNFAEALNHWTFQPFGGGAVPRCDLSELSDDVLKILDDVLGEGEVSARVDDASRRLSVQESIFPGIWRVREFDRAGNGIAHWIEAGALPTEVIECAQQAAQPALPEISFPEGAMNTPALFSEMAARLSAFDRAQNAHVINLTLLPLTPDDYEILTQALPIGPVAIISRGFGSCRVTSTGVRHIWRVQYFNSKNTLILNTLTIAECPYSVLAAAEDLEDTRARLADLLLWMRECAEDQRLSNQGKS